MTKIKSKKLNRLELNQEKFNQGAEDFEIWFKNNENLFLTELNALAKMITKPEKCLSVGIGNGLFAEKLDIKKGVEPSQAMADLARARGIEVKAGKAEALPFADRSIEQILLGTILAYVEDKQKAVSEAYRVLKKGGEIIVSILPAESSFALLYRLAFLEGHYRTELSPKYPYPMDFLAGTDWLSTEELIEIMEEVGFKNLEFRQTLTKHPKYVNDEVEKSIPGYKKGDYVVVRGEK
ncbi:methyltransferase domain-containing protein [Halanaerobium hydrogeniformans]|uniref:Methyltransferase type 11 n=1 Tax=Halanaerobium hydrogeniformans TaxID=656519 RepID=E4RMV1_HALHG|nr:methyltransferase domain-containing protein [Halanaerobium hydrogeniformans]ADQ14168.1 Methyltransferase type 11 [Halanaerobium hydrogeniformans]